jgi:2-polyprenyl-3-methyl-5-hydroxy-6-metoxy-1,4-benzoquinol methylase
MKAMNPSHELRERAFHDEWAEQTPLANIKVLEAFENITALENQFILSLMGDLRGMKILDVGAGLGESTVYFAMQGAEVTANDISQAMLDRCAALGHKFGVRISTLLSSSSEGFDFGENKFDIVYGANVLHHIGAIEPFLAAVKQALKPQGRFFFFDPLTYNPAIKVYRRLAIGVRTEDERPLRFSDLNHFRRSFSEVRHREFWLTTLMIFLKYFLIDRVDPNADRYWKRILREDPNLIRWWFGPLRWLDDLLLRLPPLQFLAWNMVIWGRK